MRIAGVFFLVVGMMMGIGANLPHFVDPLSLIMTLTFVLGVLLMSGYRVGSMFASVFSTPGAPDELAAAARGWALARRASVAAGLIGTLIGAVIILNNLNDIAAIGPGSAIGIMTVIYGLVIGYGFCLPCQKYLEARAGQ